MRLFESDIVKIVWVAIAIFFIVKYVFPLLGSTFGAWISLMNQISEML